MRDLDVAAGDRLPGELDRGSRTTVYLQPEPVIVDPWLAPVEMRQRTAGKRYKPEPATTFNLTSVHGDQPKGH